MGAEVPQRRVLVVEDEASIRHLLWVLLTSLGYDSDVAVCGRQALAMLRREEFDAILLDIRCSQPDAKSVVSEIKSIQPNLVDRVLVITGELNDPEMAEWIARAGIPSVRKDHLFQNLRASLIRLQQRPAQPLSTS